MESGSSRGVGGDGGASAPSSAAFATRDHFEAELAKRLEEALTPKIPKRNADGSINRAHYRDRYHQLNTLIEKGAITGTEFERRIKPLEREIELSGLTFKEVADERSDDQRVEDAVERLLSHPEDALFETADRTLLKVKERSERLAVLAQDQLDEKQEELDEQWEAELRRRADRGKAMGRRIDLVLRLRDQVRVPCPRGINPRHAHGWRATRAGRLMIYAMRSDVADGDPIFDIGPHHATMFIGYWRCYDRVAMFPKGATNWPQGGPKRGVRDCNGCIQICPPRHTKTSAAGATIAMLIADNTKMQWKFTHAKKQMAAQNKNLVGQLFCSGIPKYETAASRRMKALFPELPKPVKCNDQELRLFRETKDPTIFADGLSASVLGTNADGVWADDPCDPKVQNEETTREKNHNDLSKKWMRRVQGKNYLVFISATKWHENDAVCRLVARAEAGDLNYIVCVQRVGGPDTSPRFFSIWDAYPPDVLRSIFLGQMEGNIERWACEYMADPRAASQRVVRRLALYVSSLGECRNPPAAYVEAFKQHQRFMKEARYYLSLDPAATKKSTSDKASLIWAGAGDVVQTETRDDGTAVHKRNRRIRVLDFEEFYATQIDGAEHIKLYSLSRKVDELVIEGVSGYAVSGQLLSNEFPNVRVHQMHPQSYAGRSADKVRRLKQVAGMLDDGLRDIGMNPPVCEFPGILNEKGELVPHPKLKTLYDQIIYAGKTTADNGLDATTQLLALLRGDYPAGEGEFTQMVAAKATEPFSPRPNWLPTVTWQDLGKQPKRTATEDELVWMSRLN